WLPQASVARYVRVIVYLFAQVCVPIASPTWITVGAGSQLSLTSAPLPSARKLARSVAGGGTSAAHCIVTGAGHVMAGSVVSCTVIVCVHSATFPQESVALYFR